MVPKFLDQQFNDKLREGEVLGGRFPFQLLKLLILF